MYRNKIKKSSLVDMLCLYFNFSHQETKINKNMFLLCGTYRIRWLIITPSSVLQAAQTTLYLLLEYEEYEESLAILITAVWAPLMMLADNSCDSLHQ